MATITRPEHPLKTPRNGVQNPAENAGTPRVWLEKAMAIEELFPVKIEEKIEGAIPNDRFASLADTTCNTLLGRVAATCRLPRVEWASAFSDFLYALRLLEVDSVWWSRLGHVWRHGPSTKCLHPLGIELSGKCHKVDRSRSADFQDRCRQPMRRGSECIANSSRLR